MVEFISAFFLIFVAEMGDKTQLLALAFSTKYKVRQVLEGVFLGVFLNHALAIVFAAFISRYASLDIIKLVASFIFLFFGFYSLVFEYEDEEDDDLKYFKNPVIAVAAAFFLGEMGDKTQLTAMALGASAKSALVVLLGTSLSMVAVSYIGIFTGKVLGKKIPEVTMKIVASIIFIFFGYSGVYNFISYAYINLATIFTFIISTLSILFLIYKINIKKREDYYLKKLSNLISLCDGCKEHNPQCQRAMEINEITEIYIGSKAPFLGNIIDYLESLKHISPEKSEKIKNLCN